ncbi:MAG: lactate racemase domain-containing protein [Lachnospiraceae bacterium]|nr:lactate racemase domain-containing protein [Lachnospiraceae bacterium]
MEEIYRTDRSGIKQEEIVADIEKMLQQYPTLKKVLIIPPDYTRCFSFAGEITQIIYKKLKQEETVVYVMPALGTHMEMSGEEKVKFFSDTVDEQDILVHHWQTDTTKIGTIPARVVSEISQGLYKEEIEVEVNHRLLDEKYDLIISVGQVVPHEVVGMANYSKNLFVGVGGRSMINKSHMLSAVCGMERALGVTDSPARMLYDYGQQHFIDGKIPVVFIQTVTTKQEHNLNLNGLYIGTSRRPFELAAKLSQELNIVHLDRRVKKMVVYLDPQELKTTWVGNKGIYRTRMAIADGGELLLIAPGIGAFGENEEMDAMIREYGYKGRDNVLRLYEQGVFENRTMCAAHLIQGSTDGRFSVTYATCPEKMPQKAIEQVGYHWKNYYEVIQQYDPESMKDGWNKTEQGEEFYFVRTPALGLWKYDDCHVNI